MKEIGKRSFVFFIEWADILMDYPAEVRLEVYDAIIEYVASGTTTELEPQAKMAFSFIKRQIDRDNAKYDAIITKRSEAGKKGVECKQNKQMQAKQANASKTSKCLQAQANQAVDVDVNDNVDVDVDVDDIKEKGNTGVLPQKKKTDACPAVVKSEKIGYAENVSLTNAEYEALTERYGKEAADAMIEILDNYKGANGRRYESDYRAILSWVVKRYNEDIQDESRHHGQQHRNNNNGGRGMFTREQCDAVLRAADMLGDAEDDE